jgi:hypothetical protein
VTTHSDQHGQSPLMKTLTFFGLAAVGGVAGYVSVQLSHMEAMSGGWADRLALAMAFALLTVAILSAVTLVVRPSSIPKGCGILQVVVFALAGLMFLAPIYASDFVRADLVFTAIVAVFALQTVANVLLWRRADEMMRRVMAETSMMAFWALQSALFLYAAAERLGLVESITAWGMIGILMAVYLVSSIVAAARRGLH